MNKFKDLEFKPHSIGDGVQAIMNFKNGYGVSVVKFSGSYGYPNLWELGVLYGGDLTYNTPITEDVMGNLSENEVSEVMLKVQKLT